MSFLSRADRWLGRFIRAGWRRRASAPQLRARPGRAPRRSPGTLAHQGLDEPEAQASATATHNDGLVLEAHRPAPVFVSAELGRSGPRKRVTVARVAPRSRTPGTRRSTVRRMLVLSSGWPLGSPRTRRIARNPGAAEIIGTNLPLPNPGQRTRAAPPPRHFAARREGAPITLKSIGSGGTEPGPGRGNGRGLSRSQLHGVPHLAVGDMAARHEFTGLRGYLRMGQNHSQ